MSKKKNSVKPTISTPQVPPQYKTEKTVILRENAFNWRENRLNIVVLMVLASLLYLSTIGFDYALDDTMVITKNKFTQQGFEGIADIFRYESFRGYFGEQKNLLEGDRYRPLSIATFAAEIGFFGKDCTALSHFINILLYAFTALLLYRVLVFMFPKPIFSENDPLSKNAYLSTFLTIPFLATAFFIAHPLHVEVVANIKGRDEILCLLGELGTLFYMFKYLNYKNNKYIIYSFLSFYVAILSKESAITFLAIAPLTAYFFTKNSKKDILKITLPIFLATIIYVFMRMNAIGYLLGSQTVTDVMNNPFYGMTLSDRLATIFYTLLLYLKLHIFPHPLTHDYYPYQIPRLTWSDSRAILGLVLHLGLIAVILRGWRTRSIWSYAATFYVITLSIVSNLLVSVGTFMNERFVYHASLGFCIALAYFLMQKFIPKNVTLCLAVLIVLGFSIRTLMRVPDWKNGETLNLSAIRYSPNSARANCFYGVNIWTEKFLKLPKDATNAQKKVVLDEAKPYFERSIEIVPQYSSALKMWSGVAAEYHKIDGNLDNLLAAYDRINAVQVYEPFMIQYLAFVNKSVKTRENALKLRGFHEKSRNFFKERQPTSTISDEYQKLLDEINTRLPSL